MPKLISDYIRKYAREIDGKYWSGKIKKDYGIEVPAETNPSYFTHLYKALSSIPAKLIKDCKINQLKFDDLGVSKEYYPNHGIYTSDGTLVLNYQMFDDPKEFDDGYKHTMDRFTHTLYHELGHGFDMLEGSEESLKSEWLKLSGWSKEPVLGLKRIVIRESGCPEIKGEWFYDPSATFSRFYGKRNPYDDYADTFSFYVGGLKGIIPDNKLEYFDKILNKYYKKKKVAIMAPPLKKEVRDAYERYTKEKGIDEFRKYLHSDLHKDEKILEENGYNPVDLTKEKLKKEEEKVRLLQEELNRALRQHAIRMKRAAFDLIRVCHELLDIGKNIEAEYIISLLNNKGV